jgi:hypothetical protein
LEAVKELAVSARDADDPEKALAFICEQIQMLDQLIQRAKSEEGAIYAWASGQ